MAPPITVIGIGNPYRHDDAAGLVVLARLQHRFHGDRRVRMAELDGEPVRLIQAWEGSDHVLIVDAVRSLQPAGTIHRFTADGLTGATADGVALGGGHLLGLGEAIDLARAISRLPRELDVVGIEGADFELGEGLSDAVSAACETATATIVERIEQLLQALDAEPAVPALSEG
ncbi:MAG: hydrogenase maturation protease [Ilumatobacteraceae bacterium]